MAIESRRPRPSPDAPGVSPLAIGAALLLSAALGTGWWTGRRSGPLERVAENPLADAQFTRVTDFPGSESDAAISSDGRFVVFLSDYGGVPDVWLNQLGTSGFSNLTQGRESPGNFVFSSETWG